MRSPTLDVDTLVEADDVAGDLDQEFDLDEQRVGQVDLSQARGEGRIARSLLRGSTLSTSRFGPLELADTRFDGVHLANASWLPVRARQVEFLGCRATGWRLELDVAQDVYLYGCLLDYAVIEVRRVKGLLVFEDCAFSGAVLAGDLSTVVFAGCDLGEAEFDASKATDCDLRSSTLVAARGLGTLSGAILDLEQAMSAGPRLAAEAGLQVRDG